MNDQVSSILERWFISEPAIFRVLCTHDIIEVSSLSCPIRSGQRRIEYNPSFFDKTSSKALEQALMKEGVRILLRHPYARRPDSCCLQAITIGSDITIGDNYPFPDFKVERPSDYSLPGGKHYEWYSRKLQEQLSELNSHEPNNEFEESLSKVSNPADNAETTDSNGFFLGGNFNSEETIQKEEYTTVNSTNNIDTESLIFEHWARYHEIDTAVSELWDEDELTSALIVQIIQNTKDWGSLTGGFSEYLQASVKAQISWRNILSGFRASIISSKRKLTRMRPNRRTGFSNMGSIHRFETRLLVAVDVSGSITTEDLQYFYGVVNSAFRYGISAVDVIEFDVGITSVRSLKKVIKDVKVLGRGGTSFQEPIQYANDNEYDGLIILTDGYAKKPKIPDRMKCKIVWVCRDQSCYDDNQHWMNKIGRTCIMDI